MSAKSDETLNFLNTERREVKSLHSTPNRLEASTAQSEAEAFSLSLASIASQVRKERNHHSKQRRNQGSEADYLSTNENVASVTTTSSTAANASTPREDNEGSSHSLSRWSSVQKRNETSKQQPLHESDGTLPLDAQRGVDHATVVANHLPAPYPDATSSSGENERLLVKADRRRSFLSPCPEPGFHTIKQAFRRLARNKRRRYSFEVVQNYSTDERENDLSCGNCAAVSTNPREDEASSDNSSSSGSGTEGGYAASASSSDPVLRNNALSSISVSSSSESDSVDRNYSRSNGRSVNPKRPMLCQKSGKPYPPLSSDIDDFSRSINEASVSSSVTSSSVNEGSSDDQVESHLRLSRTKSNHSQRIPTNAKEKITTVGAPIMKIGSDVMAHVLTFLEPPEILDILTAPLSKDWVTIFMQQKELWRVLCHLEPFHAQPPDDSDDRPSPLKFRSDAIETFGKYRIMYTSFVRCMKYLSQIHEDATQGRAPTCVDFAGPLLHMEQQDFVSSNQQLREFMADMRGVAKNPGGHAVEKVIPDDDKIDGAHPVGVLDDGKATELERKRKREGFVSSDSTRKVKFAPSMITRRLLGPASTGQVGDTNLPWSCAIYSIVNWMAAFQDVEGIQVMCLKVLPLIMENEHHRTTAQQAGLTDIVLRGMVRFPDSAKLHTAAFHAIVLLARPLGGQEGMLFHTVMGNSSGIFHRSQTCHGRKNGIAVMLDSMKRFIDNAALQAMSCWSLVNIALVPVQKKVLLRLGGIEAATNAMMNHPYDAEVQV